MIQRRSRDKNNSEGSGKEEDGSCDSQFQVKQVVQKTGRNCYSQEGGPVSEKEVGLVGELMSIEDWMGVPVVITVLILGRNKIGAILEARERHRQTVR